MGVVLLVIGIIVLLIIIWLMSIDGSYHVKKSIEINVSRQKAYAQIADFTSWPLWSPWLCMEPGARVEVTQDGKGVGAVNRWEGKLVGIGEIEHLNLNESESIDQEIRFVKPFKSRSEVYWRFNVVGEGCEVTWGMRGKMPFLFKFMAKKVAPWIGMDYERGLKMLKDLLEKGHIASSVRIDGVTSLDAFDFLAIKASCPMANVGESMKATFARISTFCDDKALNVDSAFSIYHKFDFSDPECTYSSGVPLSSVIRPGEGFYTDRYPEIKAVKVTFKGDYEHLGNGWAAAFMYLRTQKLKLNKKVDPIEIYLNDPSQEPDPANWETAIYIPIK
ncbi:MULTISPECIES: SRPBCC family protein [unclassified Carboxylicivirga]|uniref:SRPBCC family protein n=1 Tax=Carboxylicivirga TaxID=1628153 RepID=UPI003D35624E